MTRAESHTTTRRWKNRRNLWEEKNEMRFVIYRRAGNIYRRTSRRYKLGSRPAAMREAKALAARLIACPVNKLQTFKF